MFNLFLIIATVRYFCCNILILDCGLWGLTPETFGRESNTLTTAGHSAKSSQVKYIYSLNLLPEGIEYLLFKTWELSFRMFLA